MTAIKFMGGKNVNKNSVKVLKGINQPSCINPEFLNGTRKGKRKKYSVDDYLSGILSGNRTILSQAITLVESSLPENYETAQEIVSRCLPFGGKSVRIGITGVPGVGKSSFIESFGLHLLTEKRRVAVLAVDPSSDQTKGSILGDKTRMEKLSVHPDAFIRPSPSAGSLGGVARKTREAIILCEAAGYDTILVETVGVGQSETAVHSMVDFFLLLMLTGAGDEIQGIKRGIMEMADAIAITKADGSNRLAAEGAKVLYENALHLFPPQPSGWKPEVLTCSAFENEGMRQIWEKICDYVTFTSSNGYFNLLRKQQAVIRMHDTINEYLNNSFYSNDEVNMLKPLLEQQLIEGKLTSFQAANILIDKYNNR